MTDASQAGWRFDNRYARLPSAFYTRVAPTPVAAPRLALLNRALAAELGLNADALDSTSGAAMLAGNTAPPDADCLAQAYAGHQYGRFVMLGDGRAILLGEHLTPDGQRIDIHLKGAGPTPYSRGGDGRAALGPMAREYLISEAMHALGIPTTRSLAVAATGEPVYRERALPGAVLARTAASHLRVGTFEYAAALDDRAALQALADYAIARHDPLAAAMDDPSERYLGFLRGVIERHAVLIAHWLRVGFIHGVMNTDNMTISGHTIDYGPCAFLDAYDPNAVFSSIDRHGRYAFGAQPAIAQWNLARLAETLLPLLDADPDAALEKARAAVAEFTPAFQRHWRAAMRGKLGLLDESPLDEALIDDLLDWMRRHEADYVNTWRALASDDALTREPALQQDDFLAWRERWQARRLRQSASPQEQRRVMRAHSPAIIPRNHLVEAALNAATDAGDFGPLNRLLDALAAPYDDGERPDAFYQPPTPDQRVFKTFCGT